MQIQGPSFGSQVDHDNRVAIFGEMLSKIFFAGCLQKNYNKVCGFTKHVSRELSANIDGIYLYAMIRSILLCLTR